MSGWVMNKQMSLTHSKNQRRIFMKEGREKIIYAKFIYFILL